MIAVHHLLRHAGHCLHTKSLALSLCLGLSLVASSARADQPEPEAGLVWKESWPRFHVAEYVTTGALLTGVGVSLFTAPQTLHGWRGGILSDDSLRERFVLGNYDDRQTAVTGGDIFYYGLRLYPVVVDVALTAWLAQQSPDVAWQMFMIDAQAFAFTGLASTLTQKLVGRSRPFATRCDADPGYDPDCDDADTASQSFISGHTAMAFTGAGLICAHHRNLALYGSRAADLLACGTGLLGGVLVASSRIVADRHYVSDAAIAAILGLGSGWLMPELLHYQFDGDMPWSMGSRTKAMLLPRVTPESVGLQLIAQ